MEKIRINLPGKKFIINRVTTVFPVVVILIFGVISGSCTSPRYLARTSIPGKFLENPAIADTHVGIAIYDPGTGEYVYTHNSDKFFVPASNVKLPTLYAGLKYLDEGIPGVRYLDYNDTIFLQATGDPTFLLMDFPDQPVFDFMRQAGKPLVFIEPEWQTGALGYGWPWNFYLNYYMPERSPLPVYGNVVIWAQRDMGSYVQDAGITYASSFPGHNWPVEVKESPHGRFEVSRPLTLNDYTVYLGLEGESDLFVPFATNGMQAALELLADTLNRDIYLAPSRPGLMDIPGLRMKLTGDRDSVPRVQRQLMGDRDVVPEIHRQLMDGRYPDPEGDRHSINWQGAGRFMTITSTVSDSLFRPMMLHSDNFFAEQLLIVVSNELFGVMDEMLVIDYLLDNDLDGIPDRPRWIDGSGLSRYNLFTPRSFVWLLEKMKNEFGFERVSHLLPTGGEGTLENLYREEKGKIYAKTGTLGGNAVTLSGFLVTERGRKLIFSVLVNNHNKDSNKVRAATRDFLKEIIYRY